MSTWNVGIASLRRTTLTKELFEEYQKAGIRAMEVSLNCNMMGLEKARDIFRNCGLMDAVKYSKETDVELWSYHLPFDHSEVNPASFDAHVRKNTIELDTEMIKAVSEAGIKKAVLHASGEPISDADRAESMKYAKDSIFLLNEVAKASGVTLAVENLPRTCIGKNSAEMLELIAVDPAVKICFDVNHLLEESHRDFVKAVGKHIVTLHVSDYDFIDERHLAPGKGKIDWAELVELLKEAGYNGYFMNEVVAVMEREKTDKNITMSELRALNEKIL